MMKKLNDIMNSKTNSPPSGKNKSINSEKCSKMQESLSKASEIIKYMNKEMENYK